MVQRFKKLIAPLLVTVTVFAASAGIGFFGVQQVAAQSLKDEACAGASLGGATDCSGGAAASQQVNTIITTVINILSWIVGIAAVIMIIIGGFRYITSGGDSGNVNGAKNTILYAIVGLVVVALAQIIVQFVLNRVNTPAP